MGASGSFARVASDRERADAVRPPPPAPALPPPMSPFPGFRSLLLCLLGASLLSAAADDERRPEPPRIPEKEFSAAALGVTPGSAAPVTAALQKAIDHVAAEGGGRLTLAPGDYLLGPVTLASRLDLHLSEGVLIRLIPRGDDFPTANGRHASLFSASLATDLRIGGAGRIDGGGEPWWTAFRSKELTLRRPQIIALERCERVELAGFTSINPPNTHVALRLCREVTIRDITLEAPDESANTDGLNISGKNYLIERCRISTGDDNIVILTHSAADWPPPVCEDFVIRDCTLGFGHGLSIGSYTGGGIRGLLAERITFDGTTSGIRMKAARGRGGLVEDLTYRDITMRGVQNPVFISSYYPKEPRSPELDAAVPVTALTPRWRDILIENLAVTDSQNSLTLWGVPELPLDRITLKNATFATARGARLYHAPGVVLDNVVITPQSGPEFDVRP